MCVCMCVCVNACMYQCSVLLYIVAHIFFDDAMEVDDDDKWRANSYVKMLISLVQEACR